MTAIVLRGDARHLPLPDESVDLVVTSPPYFSLRDYRDGDGSLTGQIGSEATPREYVDALLACTREWMRALKPSGSIFVNLGDKYSQRVAARASSHQDGLFPDRPDLVKDWRRDRAAGLARMPYENVIDDTGNYVREKSLIGLPWRYALGCIDDIGLILRAEVIWSKPNGLPESVTDRVRRNHEQWFHLVKQPRYYSAVDEIREQYAPTSLIRFKTPLTPRTSARGMPGEVRDEFQPWHADAALGKLPGSGVWEIATQPLTVPASLGVDHFAAFPLEWPRRLILGWSPTAICTSCCEGRRPVVDKPGLLGGDNNPESRSKERRFSTLDGGQKNWERRMANPDRITGYVCACTPWTDHPERRQPSVTPGRNLGRGHQEDRTELTGRRHHGNDWPERPPVRDWHLAEWQPAPTRPAVVLDPFGGTGSTALVADALGRTGISVDRSADYCRLARWRTTDPGERAKALQVPKPPPVPDGQMDLFGEAAS